MSATDLQSFPFVRKSVHKLSVATQRYLKQEERRVHESQKCHLTSSEDSPSKLARFGGWKETAKPARKAQEEERQRWADEVTVYLLTLTSTPAAERAARTADSRHSAGRMCANAGYELGDG